MYPQCEAPQSPSSWSTRLAASCWNWPNTSLEICSYIDKWYLNLNFCCANAWFKEEFSMIFANQSIDCWMVINISQDPPPTWPVGQKDYFQPRVFFVSSLIWSGVWMVCRNPTCKFSTLEKEKAHPQWRKIVERGHGGKIRIVEWDTAQLNSFRIPALPLGTEYHPSKQANKSLSTSNLQNEEECFE